MIAKYYKGTNKLANFADKSPHTDAFGAVWSRSCGTEGYYLPKALRCSTRWANKYRYFLFPTVATEGSELC